MAIKMRVLVTGASGLLGGYLVRELRAADAAVTAWSGSHSSDYFGVPLRPVDLAVADAVRDAFRQARPSCIIHTAAMSRISDCYRDPERAPRINVTGSALLAELAAKAGVRLVHISTDLVFDGERGSYREDDEAMPLSVYGRTKRDAELAVLPFPRVVVARCSLLFGPSLTERVGFFDQQVGAFSRRQTLTLFDDEWRTPLSLRTAASALVSLAHSDFTGMIHIGGPERMSRLEMGTRLATYLDVEAPPISAVNRNSILADEPRPRDTSLDSSKWRSLCPDLPWPRYEDALREMITPNPASGPA